MKEQQVDVVVVAVDLEVTLAGHEAEPAAELENGALQPVHEGLLEFTLGDLTGQAEGAEHVGVLRQLLGKFGIRRREPGAEVRRGGADSKMGGAFDLVQQHVARPAVFGARGGVPVASFQVGNLVQQDSDVAPGPPG